MSRNRSAVVPRGDVLKRRQKGSRKAGLVDRGRRGCDDGGAVLACRHEGCDVFDLAIKGGAIVLECSCTAQRSVALAKVRHGRFEMKVDFGVVRQGAGDWWPSWHRKKRNSDADGADTPCEALIACVRRQ